LFALIVIFRTIGGLNGKRPFTNGHRKSALFLMIFTDIQLLLGLGLYFTRNWFQNLTSGDMGGVMKNAVTRFWTIEHALGMLVGVILIHVAYANAKKAIPDGPRFRRVFWFTLIALIIILATIPWPNRPAGIGRGLMPGMSAGA
jgi:uncharacterized membrane protein